MRSVIVAAAGALLLTACGSADQPEQQEQPTTRSIEVRSADQERLHELNDLNRSIALKRALQDSGYRCRRLIESGFVGTYENLDMWMARCDDQREWAIFVGPDGSAQVRDCEDVSGFGLPQCEITSKRAGAGELPAPE